MTEDQQIERMAIELYNKWHRQWKDAKGQGWAQFCTAWHLSKIQPLAEAAKDTIKRLGSKSNNLDSLRKALKDLEE